MNVDIYAEKDADAAAQQAAATLTDIIAGYKSVPVLLLLSGGSPLEILKYLKHDLFAENVTLTVSDDRFSVDPAINNFMQIMHLPAKHWIDTRPLQGESLKACGDRFDDALKNWKKNNPDGKIVMTQGIGLDGHTVGMIGKIFDTEGEWAVGYEAQNKYPLRVTTTAPFLRMVDESVLYVCGKEKQRPLEATLAKGGSMDKTPARIIDEMKHCLLFTDLTI